MMIIFASKKGELKEKTQDAYFSLPIKNPNPLLKNGFGFQNWLKIGRIRIRIANPNFKTQLKNREQGPHLVNLQLLTIASSILYFNGWIRQKRP